MYQPSRTKREFAVWCPDYGEEREDAWQCQAFDAEQAAEQWAEWSDWSSADYTIVAGRDEPEVLVLEAGATTPVRFVVTGEAVPSYRARELA